MGNEKKKLKINKKKCGKCTRKSFRARNRSLCDLCETKEEEASTTAITTTSTTTTEAMTETTPSPKTLHRMINAKRAQKIKERCQKCQRKHFRNRNEKFCDSKCSADDEMDKDEMEVQTEAVTTTTSTEESSTADVKSVSSSTEASNNDDKMETETEAVMKSEDDEEMMSEETTTKKAKGRRKNKNKKNNKKVSNLKNEDEHEWEYVDIETRKAGPLESFIKYLFKRSRK